MILQNLYETLVVSPIFRNENFEIIESSVCFSVFISFWYFLDIYVPSLHEFRIYKGKDGFASWKGREYAWLNEMLWYVIPWFVANQIWPGRREKILASAASVDVTVELVILQTLSSLFVYDVLFYIGHRAMHQIPVIRKLGIHDKHHSMNEKITATDAVRHTFFDGTFDVLCSVYALKIVGSHPLSRFTHNIVATWLITEAHSGYDFPWSISRMFQGLLISPKKHQAHHERGDKMYGKFFSVMDYCFNTYDNR